MEVQRFEQAILKLAFETDAKITTASVAYYLGIPSREANRLLNQLLEEGVLELDSDEEGNLYYRVPSKPELNPRARPTAFENTAFEDTAFEDDDTLAPGESDAARDQPSAAPHETGSTPIPAFPAPGSSPFGHFVSVDDDSAPAFSPHPPPTVRTHQALHEDPYPGPGPAVPHAQHQPHAHQSNPYLRHAPYGRTQGSGGGHDGDARRPHSPVVDPSEYRFGPGQTERRSDRWQERRWTPSNGPSTRTATAYEEDLFYGTTARVAAPDATLSRCGASNMVVSTEVRCEPKPLPEARPVVVSCTGFDASQTTIAQTDYGFGYATPRASTALATANDFALTADNHIEQPEHQPGMALLLSLILCGTGQIYNGEVSKGIIMMVLCFLLWFVLLGWVVHIWSIVDAVVVAERINRKHN